MDSQVAQQLQSLGLIVEKLGKQRDEAVKKLNKAQEEIADLRLRLKEKDEALYRKTLDVEFLSLSHKLADNPQALADARATVRRMLAKVDKALALLKDDARI